MPSETSLLQQRITTKVPGVHVRAGLHENPRYFSMPPPNGFMQKGVALGVPGVYVSARDGKNTHDLIVPPPDSFAEIWVAIRVACITSASSATRAFKVSTSPVQTARYRSVSSAVALSSDPEMEDEVAAAAGMYVDMTVGTGVGNVSFEKISHPPVSTMAAPLSMQVNHSLITAYTVLRRLKHHPL